MKLDIRTKTITKYKVVLSDNEAQALLEELVDMLLSAGTMRNLSVEGVRKEFPLSAGLQERLRDR